jgi:hypothetical protein
VKSGAFGGSQVVGEHLKETCHINSSLSTLGRVIRELVAAQHSSRKGHHIPYRESKLTFLLQVGAQAGPRCVPGPPAWSWSRLMQGWPQWRGPAPLHPFAWALGQGMPPPPPCLPAGLAGRQRQDHDHRQREPIRHLLL